MNGGLNKFRFMDYRNWKYLQTNKNTPPKWTASYFPLIDDTFQISFAERLTSIELLREIMRVSGHKSIIIVCNLPLVDFILLQPDIYNGFGIYCTGFVIDQLTNIIYKFEISER